MYDFLRFIPLGLGAKLELAHHLINLEMALINPLKILCIGAHISLPWKTSHVSKYSTVFMQKD